VVIVASLLVFRFGYYTVEKDIPKIDDGFFVTKLEKTEVADSDNLFMEVRNFEYTEDSKMKSLKALMASCYFGDECRGGLDAYQEAMQGENVSWADKKVLSDAGEILAVKAYLKEHIDVLFRYQGKDFDALAEKLLTNLSQKKHYQPLQGNEIITYGEYA
jgi:signal transduction protein with GAF and PtsI domain